jgi:hypothetical protein
VSFVDRMSRALTTRKHGTHHKKAWHSPQMLL